MCKSRFKQLKTNHFFSVFKSHCQQEPRKMESGGFTDRPGTIFFLFLIQSYYNFQILSPLALHLVKIFDFWYMDSRKRQKMHQNVFSYKFSKSYPICMKFISNDKNISSNEIQIDF